MVRIGQVFRTSEYFPLNVISINQKRLLDNYTALTKINPQMQISPILKSNAYGHGLTLIAPLLAQTDCPFFCVDSLYEAYELLKIKIKKPILITGYVNPLNLRFKKLPFAYAAFNLKHLRDLLHYQPQAQIHLFVDTGLHREGLPYADLPAFLKKLKLKEIKAITGLMSHLACAEIPSHPLNQQQIKNFTLAKKLCLRAGIRLKWIHLFNSAGIKNFRQKLGVTNVARIGLSLFLQKPILKLTSEIIQIKKIPPNSFVGYHATYQARRQITLGILPLGYNEGVDFRLSNCGQVKIGRIFCPIIGRVSMNQTVIDITRFKNPKPEQKVIIFSDNQKDPNSVINVAKICQIRPYEILVHLHPSIRREIE